MSEPEAVDESHEDVEPSACLAVILVETIRRIPQIVHPETLRLCRQQVLSP